MTPQNPAYKERIAEIFGSAPFIQHLGITLADCGPGWCETRLLLRPEHHQQNGYVHAGVMGTMADHTAGAAAATLMAADEIVLTVEYKLHLLRPAQGWELFCRAEVLRPGRSISVVESEVYALDETGKRTLVSKLIATMTQLKKN